MSKDEEVGGGIPMALTMMAAAASVAYSLVAVKLGEGFAIPVGIIGFIAATIVLRGPLGHALARRLEGDGGANTAQHEELLHSLDDVRNRLAEVEERLDFTERLLAQQREPDRIARGEP